MARKLNTKFVAALVAVPILAVGGAGGYYVARKAHLFDASIATLEKQGDVAIAAGNFEDAVRNYGPAANRAKTDIPLQIKFVDAYDFCVQGDYEKFKELRKYYAMIHSQDPRNVEAMRRILRLQLNDLRGYPNDRARSRALKQTAESLLAQAPDDREARKALVTATLEPYQRRLETNAEEVDDARKKAEALYAEDPTDGEVILMVSQFKLLEAQAAAERETTAIVKDKLKAARDFVDEAMKKAPENADAYMAAFNTYHVIFLTSPASPDFDKDKRLELAKIADGLIDKADQYATASLPPERLLNIRWLAIRNIQLHDRKLAEDRYRKLQEELPNSRLPRLMLAQFLAKQPNRREDAITLLSSSFTPKRPLRALESMEDRGIALQEKLRLLVTLIQSMETLTDTQERAARLQKVEEGYKEIASLPNPPESWVHRIEAGIATQRGRLSDAVEKLEESLKLIAPEAQGLDRELYNELLWEAAGAHLQLGHTGRARLRLDELVKRDPINIQARIRLIDTLISERNAAEARKQMDTLRNAIGKGFNPQIESLEIRVAALFPDELKNRLKSMPETTAEELQLKFQATSMTASWDEAIRVGNAIMTANPKDSVTAVRMAQIYVRKGDRDGARTVLSNALKAKPDDTALKDYLEAIDLNTVDEQQEKIREKIESVTNPFDRHMFMAELYKSQGKLEEAIKESKEAQAINPQSIEALDSEFGVVVQQKRFNDAEAMLPKFDVLKGDAAGNELRRIRLMIAKASEQPGAEARVAMLEDAKKRAASAAQRYNDIAAATLLYAQLLHTTQNYAEAVEQYRQTLDRSTNNLEALRGIAQCLIATNRIDEAGRWLEEGRNKFPGDPTLGDLTMAFQIRYGDPIKAIDSLTSALSKNKDKTASWLQLGLAFEQIARVRTEKGDTATAKQYTERATKHWAEAVSAFPDNLQFANLLADAKRRDGDAAGAEKVLESAAQLPANVNRVEVVEALAEQYIRSSKLTQAEKVLKDLVTRTQPPPTSTLLRLSVIYVQMNKPAEALAILDLKKDDPAIQRQRVELMIAAGDLNGARAAIESALSKQVTPDLTLVAGFVELRAGNLKKAAEYFEQTLAARPRDPAALYYRSQLRLMSSPPNYDGAKEDLEQVVAQAPSNLEARLSLATIYSQTGDISGAINSLEQAWVASGRSSKLVMLRLLNTYLTTVPPRTIDAQRLLDAAKDSPQLAADPEVMLAQASLHATRGENAKAIDAAKKAFAAAPGNQDMVRGYFDILLRAKAYRAVLNETDPILQKDKSQWWLRVLRAKADMKLDQRVDAGKEYDAALSVVTASNDVMAISVLSRAIAEDLGPQEAVKRIEPLAKTDNNLRLIMASLLMGTDASKALEYLERVQADKPKLTPQQYRDTLNALGSTYLAVKPQQAGKSLQAYEELVQQTPNDLQLLNNLAYVHAIPESGGSKERALAYSLRAYELAQATMSPGSQDALRIADTYGWSLIQAGKLTDGLDLLQKSAPSAKFPEMFVHLAYAYNQVDDVDRADAALKTAGEMISQTERDRKTLDSTLRAQYEEITDAVARKRKNAVGAAK